MSEWQPIETAPKDGTRVLLLETKPIKDVSIARWVGSPHDVWIADRGNYIRRPAGWMPIPAYSLPSKFDCKALEKNRLAIEENRRARAMIEDELQPSSPLPLKVQP